MIEEDNFLWKILSLFGFKIPGLYLKTHEKYIYFITSTVYFICMMHFFSASIYIIFTSRFVVMGNIAYAIIPAQFFLIWYFLYRVGRKLSIIRQKLHRYRKIFTRNYKRTCFVNFFVVCIIILPGVVSIVVSILDQENTAYIWSYGYEIDNKIIIRALTFYGNFLYYFTRTFFASITFSLSFLFYRWNEVLKDYNNLFNIYIKERKK